MRRGERAVLDRDGAAAQRKPLEGDGQRRPAPRGAVEEIGDVELGRAGADDPERRSLERGVRDPHVTTHEIAKTEPRLQPLERHQRTLIVIRHAEVAQGEPAAEQIELEGRERDRASGHRSHPPHDHPAGDLGEGEDTGPRQCDERDGRDNDAAETATTVRAAIAHRS